VIVVVKIGTSSITDRQGALDPEAIGGLCAQVADLHRAGHKVVVVTSGGIAAGLPALGLSAERRPRDAVTLQAASAVGQSRLMGLYDEALAEQDLIAGQVLLAPRDFMIRSQYLYARGTLERLLELGVVPVINENDAIADDEIRFGDNDRLSALVAHLLGADLLILLTDTPGLLTADPRLDQSGSLIEEIVEVDQEIEELAGGSGTKRGSGGMASKVTAAKISAWSGVRAVIADAKRPGVMVGAVAGEAVGTLVLPREKKLASRKLWIAFAVGSSGTVVVDAGARRALVEHNRSLLPAGIVRVDGHFDPEQAVEVADQQGEVFAKGIVKVDSTTLSAAAGKQTGDLPDGVPHEVIHKDDLVVLP
jgi:glutamate 5-kinase